MYLVHSFPSTDSKREWSDEVLFLPQEHGQLVPPLSPSHSYPALPGPEDPLDIFRAEMALGWMLETAQFAAYHKIQMYWDIQALLRGLAGGLASAKEAGMSDVTTKGDAETPIL